MKAFDGSPREAMPPPTMTAPTPMEEEPASSMMSDLAKIRI